MTHEQMLKEPFEENEIEWRVQSCGKTNGKIWARVLAYVQARAIQDRFDKVFGFAKWNTKYEIIQGAISGILCTITAQTDNGLVVAQDGAEPTDIEAFKGGLSSAFKRTASVIGCGRYLYDLEAGFATVVERGTPGARLGTTKEKEYFYWLPPKLPAWALPKKKEAQPQMAGTQPRQTWTPKN